MGSQKRVSAGKKINPHFWVFCEGETEEAYVKQLRSEYRLPVEIISKIAGYNINDSYIKSFKRGKPTHSKDKDFLMYDSDVYEFLEKLRKINSVILITSNPAIELWFLLHYKNQKTEISEDQCIRELCNRNNNKYKKGIIDNQLLIKLREKRKEAIFRAKQLVLCDNPSTNIYVFIDYLEQAKREKTGVMDKNQAIF